MQRFAWAAPLLAGAAVRLMAAWFALGFHARDDYFHVLLPALRWLHDPSFDWDHSDLPGAGIRSHLLPRFVWGVLRVCQSVGITTPEAQLRTLYLLMGAYSLTLVPAMYYAARRHFDAPTAQRAAWLAALFFPFPYAGTRLLIEALAMPPLCAALALGAIPSKRAQWGAGACLGLAFWWRFHVLAAALGWGLVLWRQTRRGERTATDNLGLAGGFLVLVGLQGGFDLGTTGSFLGPIWRNIAVNLQPHAGLSKSTVWGYVAILLVFTLPPATLWLGPRLMRAAKKAAAPAAALGAFLLVHSLIPHKEDRFLLPVLPLYAVLLAACLDPTAAGRSLWARTWPAARAYFLAMAALGLGIAITSQSQGNLRELMIALRQDPAAKGVVSVGPELQLYFLGERDLPSRQGPHPEENFLHQSIVQLAAEGEPPNRFVAYERDGPVLQVMLLLEGYVCAAPQKLEGWWLDRLLARLNKKRNRRRSPVLVYQCEPPGLA